VKISVIMPVYLGGYQVNIHKSASNPHKKFARAIDSFLSQTFIDSELVIVSDGDADAEKIYNWLYSQCNNIRFKLIEKQGLFSGVVRQTGLDMAQGDIVCYLDHDDMFGKNHLFTIAENFNTDYYDWVYYNDMLVKNENRDIMEVRDVKPEPSSIGTSSIAHKRNIGVKWGNGYGHDIEMIQKYLLPRPCIKIPMPQYYVCHCSGLNMDF